MQIKRFTVFQNSDLRMTALQANLICLDKHMNDSEYQDFNPENTFGRAFQKVLNENENFDAEFTPLDQLGLSPDDFHPGESKIDDINEKGMKWLRDIGVDTVIYLEKSNLKMDYSTRVPNLSILNVFYTAVLPVFWIADGFGKWDMQLDYGFKIVRTSDRMQTASYEFKQISAETDRYILNWFDHKAFDLYFSKLYLKSLRQENSL